MISISVGEAKNKLPFYLHLVEEKNEIVEITRHGKTVAFLNNQKTNSSLSKKNRFLNGVSEWNKKNSILFTNVQIDEIFNREKDLETDDFIRHNNDFDFIEDSN